jgi:hypothetical protein
MSEVPAENRSMVRRPVRLRGGFSQQTGHRAKRMPSSCGARYIGVTRSAHEGGGFDLLARQRLYGNKIRTAAGTTHQAGTDARCNP